MKAERSEGHFNGKFIRTFFESFFERLLYFRAVLYRRAVLFLELCERTPLSLLRQVTRLILLLVPSIFYSHFLALNSLLSVPQRGVSPSRAASEDYSAETKTFRVQTFIVSHNSGLWLSPLIFFTYTADSTNCLPTYRLTRET